MDKVEIIKPNIIMWAMHEDVFIIFSIQLATGEKTMKSCNDLYRMKNTTSDRFWKAS